jgi:alpha-1,3-mannosyltransferase
MVLILLLSKRLHSIFVLRLFNDGPAMTLALAALLCFMNRRWVVGCVLFSLGVSVKMNVLLFAPALLLLLIRNTGGWIGAIQHIALCGIIQAVVGAPFLLAHPVSYIARSFELGRVFTYIWTVNLKFLPEDVFVDKRVGLALLVAHLGVLGLLGVRWFGWDVTRWGQTRGGTHDSPRVIALVMFACNFVGIVFARSLHAQFWCWYAFSLPLLAAESSLGVTLALPLLAGMDYAFGYVWPTTPMSSAVLQVCHLLLLGAIAAAPLPNPAAAEGSPKPRLRGKAKTQ